MPGDGVPENDVVEHCCRHDRNADSRGHASDDRMVGTQVEQACGSHAGSCKPLDEPAPIGTSMRKGDHGLIRQVCRVTCAFKRRG
ncbi:hypothetical protein SDC9_211965 [bioreactor metagenome]|uniref:Uncharacterized protein n=1 Tax=bioreactor metagenome TaxID=1076179 RepID=A0A645JX62_9ZZZZ